jgi:hypothetical protein
MNIKDEMKLLFFDLNDIQYELLSVMKKKLN